MKVLLHAIQARADIDKHLNHVLTLVFSAREAQGGEVINTAIDRATVEMVTYHLHKTKLALDRFDDVAEELRRRADKGAS